MIGDLLDIYNDGDRDNDNSVHDNDNSVHDNHNSEHYYHYI